MLQVTTTNKENAQKNVTNKSLVIETLMKFCRKKRKMSKKCFWTIFGLLDKQLHLIGASIISKKRTDSAIFSPKIGAGIVDGTYVS